MNLGWQSFLRFLPDPHSPFVWFYFILFIFYFLFNFFFNWFLMGVVYVCVTEASSSYVPRSVSIFPLSQSWSLLSVPLR